MADRFVTKNYGRKGGKLDATKHIEAAIPRMLFPSEIVAMAKVRAAVLAGRCGGRDC